MSDFEDDSEITRDRRAVYYGENGKRYGTRSEMADRIDNLERLLAIVYLRVQFSEHAVTNRQWWSFHDWCAAEWPTHESAARVAGMLNNESPTNGPSGQKE